MTDTPRTDAHLDSITEEYGGIKSIPLERAAETVTFARALEVENDALRRDAEELANALRDVLAGHPVRNADELIARYSPLAADSSEAQR